MIEIKGLEKSFGNLKVLRDINLTIEDGDVYGLVGKSGAGKSTLLRCLNGLETYNVGSIKVDGTEINSLNKNTLRLLQKDMAMIFQHFSLMNRKTVAENIAFPMKCWKYPKSEINARVLELAKIVGIEDKLNQKANVLSGGQKQRVAIARALSMKPKYLLSDESTSALDPVTTKSILHLLRRINQELGITIIVVTHQMHVIRELCNNVALLEKGEIAVKGNVKELFLQQPDSLRRFMLTDRLPNSDNGVDLQIMLSDEYSKAILGNLGADLQVPYKIIGGKIENYQSQYLGDLVLNFQKDDIDKVCTYLSQHNVIWHKYIPLTTTTNEEVSTDV